MAVKRATMTLPFLEKDPIPLHVPRFRTCRITLTIQNFINWVDFCLPFVY
jgi:hypothetical protein